eukprot:scaffold6814_cov153-Pinguiococcus_pyrenoidosus.AAC.1
MRHTTSRLAILRSSHWSQQRFGPLIGHQCFPGRIYGSSIGQSTRLRAGGGQPTRVAVNAPRARRRRSLQTLVIARCGA